MRDVDAGAALLVMLARRSALRERAGLARVLRAREPGDRTVDLAGNDYLGLSRDASVTAAAAAALAEFGLGATGSRLVRGSTTEHAALEDELAGLLGRPSALVYSSGYLANLGALRAVARPGCVFVVDAHVHASLVDGCRLAGAETLAVPHGDVAAVADTLASLAGRFAVVVTESVFSVDGDLAPLPELHRVCRDHGALLVVDEAHALGLVGPCGRGAVAAAGLAGEADVVVTATLSKAVGAAGGVVAGHAVFVKHLVETSRTFVYDTALPPAVAAGARAALTLLAEGEPLRATVRRRAAAAAEVLAEAAGLEVTRPAAGIVSVFAPDAAAAVEWARGCAEVGVAVGCFRPPSAPDHRSRLRLTINAGVPEADFTNAVHVVADTAPAAARVR